MRNKHTAARCCCSKASSNPDCSALVLTRFISISRLLLLLLLLLLLVPADLAQRFQEQGLPLHFVTRAQQMRLATAGLVPQDLAERLADASLAERSQSQQQQQQLPIGDMQTLLQLHLAVLLQQLPARASKAAVAWVLDDDKRLLR
jgi:hypothetical protein